jgi:hypothetical protein
MMDSQWDDVAREITALWGTSNNALNLSRLAAWKERWGNSSYREVSEALHDLEKQHDRWPSVAMMYATVKQVQARDAARSPQRERQPEGPISPAEYAQIVADLCAAGSRAKDPRWQAYMYELADSYEANRLRVMRGEPRAWPPPSIGGHFGRVLRQIAEQEPIEDDHDLRRVDHYDAGAIA